MYAKVLDPNFIPFIKMLINSMNNPCINIDIDNNTMVVMTVGTPILKNSFECKSDQLKLNVSFTLHKALLTLDTNDTSTEFLFMSKPAEELISVDRYEIRLRQGNVLFSLVQEYEYPEYIDWNSGKSLVKLNPQAIKVGIVSKKLLPIAKQLKTAPARITYYESRMIIMYSNTIFVQEDLPFENWDISQPTMLGLQTLLNNYSYELLAEIDDATKTSIIHLGEKVRAAIAIEPVKIDQVDIVLSYLSDLEEIANISILDYKDSIKILGKIDIHNVGLLIYSEGMVIEISSKKINCTLGEPKGDYICNFTLSMVQLQAVFNVFDSVSALKILKGGDRIICFRSVKRNLMMSTMIS